MFWQRITSIGIGAVWGIGLPLLVYTLLVITWGNILPTWAYLATGLLVWAYVSLEDWRDAHPEMREVTDPSTLHCLCEECWRGVSPDRQPVLATQQDRGFEACCGCGETCRDGIYLEALRIFAHCDH